MVQSRAGATYLGSVKFQPLNFLDYTMNSDTVLALYLHWVNISRGTQFSTNN